MHGTGKKKKKILQSQCQTLMGSYTKQEADFDAKGVHMFFYSTSLQSIDIFVE